MHRLRRNIPSLGTLTAFEAAARRESFTRAADELGVTQAAVSRRIKALETELGRPLFDRTTRRVRLTDAGRRLFEAVGQSFDGLADAVEALRAPDTMLTIAVSVAFGHFRLLPVLSSFRELAPHTGLRVISEDTWNAPDDTRIDVAVRYGHPPFRGMRVVGSLREVLVPVAAPSVASGLHGVGIEDLARRRDLTLIESAEPEPSWLGWSQWLRRSGWTGPFGGAALRFSNYSDAIYAAMDGQGIALGWTGLLKRTLADGRLTVLDLPPLKPRERHYILVSDRRNHSELVETFVRWMETSF
ncbi:LysR family transcriptional regulator [Oceaniovalibus guishaninsula JLT2003]|uniref:LysR family transcriptional regulator n=1 Tax=Oceaniovalibus guishaninsula JLT2003 TaxID=1231392 RepID=K2HR88_9RHOB|nr:LysR substrate-binding domain-containing protein [Oceaniovalibus guishaninsula]EKE45274.1 LysR family transcriptional regulator [Oceaniovalibus guishaninsula JLT2003]